MKHDINGFFNPQRDGDTFKGLNGSIDGTVAPAIITDLPAFLKAAGRDYYIRRSPAPHPIRRDEDLAGTYWLTRSDTDAVVSPKTVTDQYAPMTLMDIAEELQPWCDQGWATPDGVYGGRFLDHGGESLEVLSLRLDAGDIDQFGGDRMVHYVVVTNPHGQGGKAQGKIITWRIVCCNTFAAAVSASYDFALTHRCGKGDDHQTIMQERMAAAVANWENAREKIAGLAEAVNAWQAIPVNMSDAGDLTKSLLGIDGKDLGEVASRTRNKFDAIMAGFNSRDAGTSGATGWDWLNAVTFYTSSPLAKSTQKSKVSSVDRMIRNIDPNGTGFALERDAKKILAAIA